MMKVRRGFWGALPGRPVFYDVGTAFRLSGFYGSDLPV